MQQGVKQLNCFVISLTVEIWFSSTKFRIRLLSFEKGSLHRTTNCSRVIVKHKSCVLFPGRSTSWERFWESECFVTSEALRNLQKSASSMFWMLHQQKHMWNHHLICKQRQQSAVFDCNNGVTNMWVTYVCKEKVHLSLAVCEIQWTWLMLQLDHIDLCYISGWLHFQKQNLLDHWKLCCKVQVWVLPTFKHPDDHAETRKLKFWTLGHAVWYNHTQIFQTPTCTCMYMGMG